MAVVKRGTTATATKARKPTPKGKDYSAIAKSKIGGPENDLKRYLIYGRNKKGKTNLGSTAPRVLIIDPEMGTGELDTEKFGNNIWPIRQWKDMDEVYRTLASGALDDEYDWILVDGLTRIHNMAIRRVMEMQEERDLDRIPGQVHQKDYGKAGELTKGMLFNFHTLPFNIIYTAQERMETPGEFESEDSDVEEAETRMVPDLPKGVRSSVNAIVNGIGRIYTVRIADDEGNKKVQRRLWLAQAEAFDTGFRSKHELPDYIKNPTVTKLVRLIATGKVTK